MPKPEVTPVEGVDPLEAELPEIDLPPRQQLFVKHYLETFNGTRSAYLAGYEGDDNVLAVQACRLLRNAKVRELIDQYIETEVMPASEVLLRLRDHARGSLKPFLTEEGFIDITTDAAQQNIGLLKEIEVEKRVGGPEDDPWTETKTKIKLHDPQSALVHLGRHHKLFTDKAEVSGPNGGPIPIASVELETATAELAAWREQQKAQLTDGKPGEC